MNEVKGKPVGLYLLLLPAGQSTLPATVTINVAAAGAAIGATQIPIEDPGVLIPKSTVLTFAPLGANQQVVVTEDFPAGAAGNLKIEMYDGIVGSGLTAALVDANSASWDLLQTVSGTENSAYANNPQSQNLSAVTYGGAGKISVQKNEVTGIAPSISRTGLFVAEEQLTKDLILYADKNRTWYVKQVLPKADGKPWQVRKGLCTVGSLQQDPPAGDFIRMSFTISFNEEPDVTFI
jgi:hypothetical protein